MECAPDLQLNLFLELTILDCVWDGLLQPNNSLMAAILSPVDGWPSAHSPSIYIARQTAIDG